MREEIEIFVEAEEGIELPTYAHDDDSGMDVRASQDVTIHIGETVIVPTGLKVAIPDGYEIQVRPRSGISYKTPLRVANSIGTVDAGYRDSIGVIITNTSNPIITMVNNPTPIYTIDEKENKSGIYQIKKDDRIAQLVLQRVPKMKLTKVDSVKDIGTDRQGGFGSTGI